MSAAARLIAVLAAVAALFLPQGGACEDAAPCAVAAASVSVIADPAERGAPDPLHAVCACLTVLFGALALAAAKRRREPRVDHRPARPPALRGRPPTFSSVTQLCVQRV